MAGYSATVTDQVHRLIDNDKLAEVLLKKYPVAHHISTDKALYAYAMDMKNQFLRQSNPLGKVVYDDKIDVWNIRKMMPIPSGRFESLAGCFRYQGSGLSATAAKLER